MTKFGDLAAFFQEKKYKMILVADAETRVSHVLNGRVITESPAGGVAVALDSIAQATSATYIARAKGSLEKQTVNERGIINIKGDNAEYSLKRLFFEEKEIENYYFGFSNQTLWPLCHVAFEEPHWTDEWYRSYKNVNQAFAAAIKDSIGPDEKAFIWINDYQLSLVPLYLGNVKNAVIAMFWHIPWPTWEIFRILPYKKEILTSLLQCDFLAFHRGYQARNFIQTVERELQTRTDEETQVVYFENNSTTIKNLPMGIDVDVVKSLIQKEGQESKLQSAIAETLSTTGARSLEHYFNKYKVIFGVDRLDYTKGLIHRMHALEEFFKKNKSFRQKAVYVGIIAPSREAVPAYQKVRRTIEELAKQINDRYGTSDWKPIHLIFQVFQRKEIVNFYSKADVCVITPLDDGMNLVSKEFVVASSMSEDPGMLVLSQFTGSSIDLTSALIVNPYDTSEVANAISEALLMPKHERIHRTLAMASQLEENNIYEWGMEFIKYALQTER